MKLTFTQAEFDKLRKFQDRLAKEFGDTAYVGTDHATVLVEFSPLLKRMLRPMPETLQFDYELSQLSCEDCGLKAMYLTLPDEKTFLCDKCGTKRKKSGEQKKA